MKIKICELKRVICELLSDPVNSQVFRDWLLEKGTVPAKFNTSEWVSQIVSARNSSDPNGAKLALKAWSEVTSARAILTSEEFLGQEEQAIQAILAVSSVMVEEVLVRYEDQEDQVDILNLTHQEISLFARNIFQGIQAVAAVGGSSQRMELQASQMVDAFDEYDPGMEIAHLFEYLLWVARIVASPNTIWDRASPLLDKLAILNFSVDAPRVAQIIVDAVPDPSPHGDLTEVILREASSDPMRTQIFQDWLLERGIKTAPIETAKWVDQIISTCKEGDPIGRKLALNAWQDLESGSEIMKSFEFKQQPGYNLVLLAATKVAIQDLLKRYSNVSSNPTSQALPEDLRDLVGQAVQVAERLLVDSNQVDFAEVMNLKNGRLWPEFTDIDDGPMCDALHFSIILLNLGSCVKSSEAQFQYELLELLTTKGYEPTADLIRQVIANPCQVGKLSEVIRKRDGKWVLYTNSKSKNGKRRRLGTHSSKLAAQRQERAIKAKGN